MIDLIQGNCLIEMQNIPSKSIDAIITDVPYGTTACKWDVIIPFEPMWKELNRIIKPKGAILLFGSEPFSSALRCSNLKQYKYDWIWNKKIGSNFASAGRTPLKVTEIISVFGGGNYYPIKTKGKMRKKGGGKQFVGVYGDKQKDKITESYLSDEYHPINIIDIGNAKRKGKQHPTQKPVELMEYLIKTYTKENETVLDFTMGSGSTGVACKNTNRNFIGIEKDDKYFEIAQKRIKGTEPNPNNFKKVEERGIFSFTDEHDKAD